MAVIVGAAGMFVAGFVALYAMGRRRGAAALQRVPVGTARRPLAVRHGADLPDISR